MANENLLDDVIDIDDFIEQKTIETRNLIHSSSEQCPLELLLRIYLKDPVPLYVDYFKGFKLFVFWLGKPLAEPEPKIKIPEILYSYEVNAIAELLNVSRKLVWVKIAQIKGLHFESTT